MLHPDAFFRSPFRLMPPPVVLVNKNDQSLGTADKLQVHTEGLLHRAFSIFLFDPTGRLLLQRRAADKYHSGGLWSNTCCSHPRPDENPLDGATRRLPEELGFRTPLTPALQKTYRLPVGDGLVEHEYNHVFVGTVESPDVHPCDTEVSDWAWMRPSALRGDVDTHPQRYTTWFRLLLPPVLSAAQASSWPSASGRDAEPLC